MSSASERIIVALDLPSVTRAMGVVQACGPDLVWAKVGLELFSAEGPRAVSSLKALNKQVFLDLKLHDIPNTVAGAVRSARNLRADLLTLHVEGGPAMMRAAVEARDGSPWPKLLGVTVLTSLKGDEFPDVYKSSEVSERVVAFAKAAEEAGLDGVICSARELKLVSGAVSSGFLRVAPGIRAAGTLSHDQARVATPAEAFRDGATHIVVGRAVTSAQRPRSALREIIDEAGTAL